MKLFKSYRCDECGLTWRRLWFQASPESPHLLWPWCNGRVPLPPPGLIKIWCGPVRLLTAEGRS